MKWAPVFALVLMACETPPGPPWCYKTSAASRAVVDMVGLPPACFGNPRDSERLRAWAQRRRDESSRVDDPMQQCALRKWAWYADYRAAKCDQDTADEAERRELLKRWTRP